MLDCTFIDLTSSELATKLGVHHRFTDQLLYFLLQRGHVQRVAYTIPKRGERLVEAALALGVGATVVAKGESKEGAYAVKGKQGRPPVVWRIPRTITIDLIGE